MRFTEPRACRPVARFQPAALGLWLALGTCTTALAQVADSIPTPEPAPANPVVEAPASEPGPAQVVEPAVVEAPTPSVPPLAVVQATASEPPPVVDEEEARGRAIADVLRVVIKSPCFDRDSLADAVEEWLGRDTIDGRVTSIQVRASQGLLSFSIELGTQTPTTREFPELPRDCVEQQSAIALSIALAVDALESDLPPALGEAPPSFQLVAHATATTGLPSALAAGGGLSFEWRPAPVLGLRAGITGVTDTAEQRLQGGLLFRYRTRLLTLRADACGRLDVGGWEAVACAGLMAGSLWTVSGGQFAGQTDAHGWYAASASAELRLAGSRTLGLVLGVDLIVPLRVIKVAVRDGNNPDSLFAWRDFPSMIGALRLGPSLSF